MRFLFTIVMFFSKVLAAASSHENGVFLSLSEIQQMSPQDLFERGQQLVKTELAKAVQCYHAASLRGHERALQKINALKELGYCFTDEPGPYPVLLPSDGAPEPASEIDIAAYEFLCTAAEEKETMKLLEAPDHVKNATSYCILGVAYYGVDDYDRAEENFRKSILCGNVDHRPFLGKTKICGGTYLELHPFYFLSTICYARRMAAPIVIYYYESGRSHMQQDMVNRVKLVIADELFLTFNDTPDSTLSEEAYAKAQELLTEGSTKDAIKQLRIAAEHKHPEALYTLGQEYVSLFEPHVPSFFLSTAVQCYHVAALAGHEKAREKIETLKEGGFSFNDDIGPYPYITMKADVQTTICLQSFITALINERFDELFCILESKGSGFFEQVDYYHYILCREIVTTHKNLKQQFPDVYFFILSCLLPDVMRLSEEDKEIIRVRRAMENPSVLAQINFVTFLDPDDSIELFEKAVETAGGNHPMAESFLYSIYKEKNEEAKAQAIKEKILSNRGVFMPLIFIDDYEYAKVIDYLEGLSQKGYEVNEFLALGYKELGEFEKAEECLKKTNLYTYSEINDKPLNGFDELGQIYFMAKRPAPFVIRCFERSTIYRPNLFRSNKYTDDGRINEIAFVLGNHKTCIPKFFTWEVDHHPFFFKNETDPDDTNEVI